MVRVVIFNTKDPPYPFRCRYFFAYAAWLVETGVFQHVELTFLMVGHTHFDNDKDFQVIMHYLNLGDVVTKVEFMEVVRGAFKATDRLPLFKVEELQVAYDWKAFLSPHIDKDLGGYQGIGWFGIHEDPGEKCARLHYKKWATDDLVHPAPHRPQIRILPTAPPLPEDAHLAVAPLNVKYTEAYVNNLKEVMAKNFRKGAMRKEHVDWWENYLQTELPPADILHFVPPSNEDIRLPAGYRTAQQPTLVVQRQSNYRLFDAILPSEQAATAFGVSLQELVDMSNRRVGYNAEVVSHAGLKKSGMQTQRRYNRENVQALGVYVELPKDAMVIVKPPHFRQPLGANPTVLESYPLWVCKVLEAWRPPPTGSSGPLPQVHLRKYIAAGNKGLVGAMRPGVWMDGPLKNKYMDSWEDREVVTSLPFHLTQSQKKVPAQVWIDVQLTTGIGRIKDLPMPLAWKKSGRAPIPEDPVMPEAVFLHEQQYEVDLQCDEKMDEL